MAEPMTDERLAELEEIGKATVFLSSGGWREVRELAVEVRRARAEADEIRSSEAEWFSLLNEARHRVAEFLGRDDGTVDDLIDRAAKAERRANELEAELVKVRAAVDRVQALHSGVHKCTPGFWYNPAGSPRAKGARPGPCPTLRAFDGGV